MLYKKLVYITMKVSYKVTGIHLITTRVYAKRHDQYQVQHHLVRNIHTHYQYYSLYPVYK